MLALALAAILVASDVPFDAATLEHALVLRAGGRLPCEAIAIERTGGGLRGTCDGRAVTIADVAESAGDAARAMALALLAVADPGIELPPSPPLPPPATPSTPSIVLNEAAQRPRRRTRDVPWTLALGANALAGAGPDDRAMLGGRLELERRARWIVGLAGAQLWRDGATVTPSMSAHVATAWVARAFGPVDVGALARGGVVELSGATDGRHAIASAGARIAVRHTFTRTLALAAVAEPTVAIRRLAVEASGTGATLATTPRVGVDLGVLLAWRID